MPIGETGKYANTVANTSRLVILLPPNAQLCMWSCSNEELIMNTSKLPHASRGRSYHIAHVYPQPGLFCHLELF